MIWYIWYDIIYDIYVWYIWYMIWYDKIWYDNDKIWYDMIDMICYDTATPPYAWMAWCLIKDVTTLPLILSFSVYSKSEEDVYSYFGAHKVMFNQIYEVRTIYR